MKFPTIGENSTKDKIISVLSTEKFISMRKLYSILKARYSLSITYHAIYKTINEMVKNKIIEKHNKFYNISHNWIIETKNFIEKIERDETSGIPPAEKLFMGELNTVTFNSQFDFFNYMIDFFTLFAHNGDRKFYGCFYHLYWALSFEGEKFVKFKKMINSFKVGYLLCNGSSQADKIISDYYMSFNPTANIKLGVNCTETCEIFVCGNYIAQVFLENKFRRKLDKVYTNIDFENQKAMRKLMETLFFTKTKITLIVTKNKTLASEIKKGVLEYF